MRAHARRGVPGPAAPVAGGCAPSRPPRAWGETAEARRGSGQVSSCWGSRGANLCSLLFRRLQGWSRAPRLHTSRGAGSWAEPRNKVVGAAPSKEALPPGLVARGRTEPSEPPAWVGSRAREGGVAGEQRGPPGAGAARSGRGRGGAGTGCDAGPRCRRRLSEPGGLAPGRAQGRAAGTRHRGGKRLGVGGAGARGLRGRRGAPGLPPVPRGSPRSQGAQAEVPRCPDSEVSRRNAALDLPACWEASVLVFPGWALAVGLKLGWVVRAMAAPAGAPSSCWALRGCLRTLTAPGWRGDPRAPEGALPGPRGFAAGPLWPVLSFCHCPQASREGTEGE